MKCVESCRVEVCRVEMGSPAHSIPKYFPPSSILMKTSIYVDKPYENKFFLHQKYVVEGLTCEEIATQIFSARTTVLKYLKIHGIPVREVGTNQKRKRGLAYGSKVQKRSVAVYKREQDTITKMRNLRDRGFSYWKIAEVLNAMKVPTKTGRGKWHARTVLSILARE